MLLDHLEIAENKNTKMKEEIKILAERLKKYELQHNELLKERVMKKKIPFGT